MADIKLKDILKRVFTKELEKDTTKTVFDLFKWKKADVLLTDYKTGRVLCDMKNLEFPEDYSQNAMDIIASKYFRKQGVPETNHETSMRQVSHRMADFWKKALVEEKLLKTKEEEQIFYDETVYAILSQMFAPNSPQWFNTGLSTAYGIKGSSQDLFYFDTKKNKVMPSPDNYTKTQASACFIVELQDKLLGEHSISEQYVTETKLFKGGSGTGTNYSNLRAQGEKLSGGGTSSGVMSFLKGLDKNAGAIKSGGATRRSARMVCLDIDHPEIREFIEWKVKEEDKVRALVKMGYDGSFEGEAYETVSGQNSNNSVRLSDEFMKKVMNLENDPDAVITLKGRKDSSVNKEVKVKDLWEEFNLAAWKCADPAPQFDDTFNAWHTCPAGEDGETYAKHNRLNSTNPCGEYAFLDNTSCNLGSINVYRFLNKKTGQFETEKFSHLVGLGQLILEASIHWGQFPTEDIARRTHLFRTTGLGISNLASLLMAEGIPYDSEEARHYAASIMSLLLSKSYFTSHLMAAEAGAFTHYDINRNYMSLVLHNHYAASGLEENTKTYGLNYDLQVIDHDILNKMGKSYMTKALEQEWELLNSADRDIGFRNAQVSVIAPCGTISFAMDCAATSIEPFFSHVIYKKLSGGGYMTISNPVISEGLAHLGYSRQEIQDITEYIAAKNDQGFVSDGKIEGAPHLKPEHYAIFDTANTCGTGKRYIHHMGHVDMVAALTPHVSGAISKTVNLPQNASVEDFKEVVIESWKKGIKGISLYRDGSKFSQPLNTKLEDNVDVNDLQNLSYKDLLKAAEEMKIREDKGFNERHKASGIRVGRTHPAQIEDVKIYTTVNRDPQTGEINEIYITTDREGTLITGLLNAVSKTVSVMLQYHIPPEDISRMLRGQKYEPYGFVSKHPYIKSVSSISDLVSKIIDIELGDFSRCQIKPEKLPEHHGSGSEQITKESHAGTSDNTAISEEVPEVYSEEKLKEIAKTGTRVYNAICSNCSSDKLVNNGTCKVCLDCGTTTGCS